MNKGTQQRPDRRKTRERQMPEIKPCPYCKLARNGYFSINRNRVLVVENGTNSSASTWHHVQCSRCGMQGPDSNTEEAAINRWNRLPREGDKCLKNKSS